MSSLFKLLKNQYVFSIITKVCNLFISILVSVIIARYLGSTIKGQVAYINNITAITSIVLSLGIYQIYPFYKKTMTFEEFVDFRQSFITAVSLFMFIECVLSLLAIGIAYQISIEIFVVVLINPILVYYKIISYCFSIDQPNRKNLFEFFINVFELIYLIVVWIFIPRNFIIGISTIILKDTLLSIWYSKEFGFKFRVRFNKNTFMVVKKLCRFGIFPMLSVLMTTLNYRVDTIMLKQFVAYSSIGVYSVGVSIAEKVWVIPDAMRDIMTSKLSSGKTADEVAMVIRVCNTICLFILIVAVLFAQPVVNFLYGEEYSGAYQVIVIILIGTIVMTSFKMIASYNIVINKQKVSLLFLTISVVANIIANIIFIPRLGINGAAWASDVSYTMCSILFLAYFTHTEKVKLRDCLIVSRKDIKALYANFKK